MDNQEVEIPLKEISEKPDIHDVSPEAESKSTSGKLYLAAIVGCLMTMVAGLSFGWSSPVISKLDGSGDPLSNPLGRPITPTEVSWITGLLCLGAIFGPIAAGPIADKVGRKRALLILACPILLSFLIIAFAKTVYIICIARLLKGLGSGSVFAVLPMYIGEIAQDHNRGALGCLMTVFTAVGFLFSYAVGPFLTVQYFCLACTIPLAIFIPVFLLWNPESPQYLASIGDQKGLEVSLMKLRNQSTKNVHVEILTINRTIAELNQNKGGVLDLFRFKNLRRGLIISMGLISLQQFGGINVVLSYMQQIFAATGSTIPPEISTIIIGIVQVATIMVASLLVDRLGRRILLLISTVGAGTSLVALGFYFYLKEKGSEVDSISWLPITSLVTYIISYSVGLQPLPWAIMAELFPTNVKSTASAITSVTCFTGAFITTTFFPSLLLSVGMGMSLWGFAVVCGFGTLFVHLIVPETKGKSLQEIQRLLEKN